MRVRDQYNEGPSMFEKKYQPTLNQNARGDCPTPITRERSTGEKVTEDLVELAKFAEEVADFMSVRTSRIVRCEPEEGCCAEDVKSPYYPEYFQILINQSNRIRDALYRIRAIGESIDL